MHLLSASAVVAQLLVLALSVVSLKDESLMVFVSADGTIESECDLSHGFGKNIDWAHYPSDALEFATKEKKPIMLIIHKSWCGAW
jgi:hypothetical protein